MPEPEPTSVSPFDWIAAPESDRAGVSLGLLIESTTQAKLAEDLGKQAANSARGKARVRAQTMTVLGRLPQVAETELIRRADEANQDPWFRHHDEEYESVGELLRSTVGDSKGASYASDVAFLADKVLPFMRNEGINGASKLIGRAGGPSSKARAMVPQFRDMFETIDDRTELKTAFEEKAALLTDPKVSEADIRATNSGTKQVDGFTVTEYIQHEGSTLVIRVTPRQRAYIENRLGIKATWEHAGKSPGSLQAVMRIRAQADAIQKQLDVLDHTSHEELDTARLTRELAKAVKALRALADSINPTTED